jgi:hypothetical protein
MTFAEIIFVCLLVTAIYRLLRPVQQRLEKWIYRRTSPVLKNQSSTITSISKIKDNDKWK